MFSLYKLITKTNLKSPAIMFPLIMPLIFVLLYSVKMDGADTAALNVMVAGFITTILSVNTMQNGLMGFGMNFITIKKSVLLRRIGATELSKFDVITAVLLFGLTLWMISTSWIIIVMVLGTLMGVFSSTSVDGVNATLAWMNNVDWLRLAVATILMMIPSYALGLFFTSVAKEDQMFMGMAMLYFFFAGFVGGLLFPGDTPKWMQDIGYVIPHSYIGNFYDWAANKSVTFWGMNETNSLIVSAVIPLAFAGILFYGSAKTLKFD